MISSDASDLLADTAQLSSGSNTARGTLLQIFAVSPF